MLLVENEPLLLAMAQKMIELLGYNIFEVNRPGDVLRITRKSTYTIDLLSTDVVMPEITGKECRPKCS